MKLFTSPILSYGLSSLLIATASAIPVRNLVSRAVGDLYQFRIESEDGSNFGDDYEFRVDFQFEDENEYTIDELLDLLNQVKTLVTAPDCNRDALSIEVSRGIANGETLSFEVVRYKETESLCDYSAYQWNVILGAVSTFNNQQNFPPAVEYQLRPVPSDDNEDDIFQFIIQSSRVV
jgi:hypothetical protein